MLAPRVASSSLEDGGIDRPAPIVTLRSDAVVTRSPILLGDVAAVTGSGGLAAAVAGVELGPAPRPGAERVITRSGIALSAGLAGVSLSPADVRGASSVTVRSSGATVEPQRIERCVREFLEESCASPGQRLEFVVTTIPRLPCGEDELQCPLLANWHARPGRDGGGLVRVGLERAGRVLASVRCQVRVHRFGTRPRLLRALGAGTEIRPSFVEFTEVRLDPRGRDPELATLTELLGKVTRTALKAGHVLRPGDLEAPVLAERGDAVWMVLDDGDIRIVARGTAQRTGRLGEQIPVQMQQTDRSVSVLLEGRRHDGVAFGSVR